MKYQSFRSLIIIHKRLALKVVKNCTVREGGRQGGRGSGKSQDLSLQVEKVSETTVNWMTMGEFIKEFLQELFVVLL